MSADPFGTAALRAAALGAWTASPARLREDANVEEDHARGYYRDRVVVELAQNAADAATRAGVPGRLLLRLTHGTGRPTLVAANTGAPLDEAGVASLASMRASSKRDATDRLVGRYGVGFAAVRAVSDDVSVLSTSGGVRFGLRDTAQLVADAAREHPALADEVRRRDGSLPALRLPLPADGRPPTGYDTAVVLELRDEVAADEVRALLLQVDDALLLALPGLVEIVVEDDDAAPRRLADVQDRWTVVTAEGELPLALLADRPVEERSARSWRVTWALPAAGTSGSSAGSSARPGAARVVHAPTPTDERLDLPALLVATLPLDPTRRHVARGPLTDALLDHAAQAYAELAERADDPLALVPTGLAAGPLDDALRPRLVAALARRPLLERADGTGMVAAPLAVAVDGDVPPAALAALGRRVAGLVVVPPGRRSQARSLGVEVRPLADLVEELPAPDDGAWRELYDALDALTVDDRAREALASLPVPLVGGRVVRGARGTVLVADEVARELGGDVLASLVGWGVRLVDPAAAHRLLVRVGAAEVDAVGLLRRPEVRRVGLDEPDDDTVTTTVLALAAAAEDTGLPADVRAWTGLLELTAADGEPTPADGLVLPGSPAAALLDDRVMAPVALDLVDRWGADALVALGVRRDVVVVAVEDVVADPAVLEAGPDDDPSVLVAQSLDGWEQYLRHLAEALGPGAYAGRVAAVADLDAVDDARWPDLLTRLAEDPEARRALLDPVRGEDGTSAPGYAAWWLRTRAGLGLGRPFALGGRRDPLLRPAPGVVAGLDDAVQRALGGVAGPSELDGAAWTALLDGLVVGAAVEPAVAAAVWRWAAPDEPPAHVPALVGPGEVRVVRSADAAVADSPMWWQRTDLAAMVPAADPAAAAHALDLSRSGDLADGVLDVGARADEGRPAAVPPGVLEVLPDVEGASTTWFEHDELRVDGVDVEWWVADGVPHAVHAAGLAAALAQAAGRWDLRFAVEAVLADPSRAADAVLGSVVEP
ncbi:sacsin N-terminal ATP-binding-like domain-containing protein [Cellulomonas sp. HZM]|uniref:sacsin N-terminal ATP-binding-like domain-containing protein n=1 Tax=Cellulomonas sp. HZM TaxID=1454010 RepID=UPI0005561B25|nr:ATP-binding protein [Cellulomonas sp. HZM]